MKRTRLLTLIPALLAVAISACSQPQDLKTPGLEAQFGGAGNDTADAISIAKSGVVTVGSSLTSVPNSNDLYQEAQLRQLDASGRLLRQASVSKVKCTATGLDCIQQKFLDIRNDAQGNVYALTTAATNRWDIPLNALTIYKYNYTLGKLLWKNEIADVDPASRSSLGLDSSGNLYVAYTPRTVTEDGYYYDGVPRFVRYSTNGVKWYQRNSNVGKINDLTVSSTGDIYVVGDKGLSRYNNGGGLTWTKAISGKAVAATKTHSYVLSDRNSEELYKVDLKGNIVYRDIVGTMTTSEDLETDTQGNVYIRGIEQYSPDDIEEKFRGFVQKVNSAGRFVWRVSPPFSENHSLNDMATNDGSSIYTVGSTSDPVNGVNRGGSDAFVTRLDAKGQQIWER